MLFAISYMPDCIFCKIASGAIPKEFLYEDDDLMVFPDIHPVKPVHILIVPKKHIPEFMAIENHDLMANITKVMQEMIKKQGLEKKGHRIIINGGGAQEVDHLHVHLMGPIARP